jgi:DNA gyrase subunit A
MGAFYHPPSFLSASSPLFLRPFFDNQRNGTRRTKTNLALLWITTTAATLLTCPTTTITTTAFSFHPSPIINGRTPVQPHRSSRTSLPFSSTTDPDFDEHVQEDDIDESTPLLVVPRETFISEADMAQQANEFIGSAAASSSSSVIDLPQEIQNSFLQYALSIILGRALPDARDGLKPVHRRILYSMHQLQLLPTLPHRKCARIVGEVLGKYHPHGDMAVYDALVRMAQDFSTLYPLVDGHGNFGSIDNDPAAAMRYTECRLTSLATQTLLQELADDTVDFTPNFDGNEIEPNVLPSKLPLLLLNGSSGIAVGMATNIPPHNVREVLQACQAILQRERIQGENSNGNDSEKALSQAELFQLIPGPDFPTGASILGKITSRRLYTTGNGGIVMRAVTHVEPAVIGGTKRQQLRTAIIVTELPYQVNKAALLEQIADLVNDKKLDGIADLRDESDRHGIRVVIELKPAALPQVVLNNLYQKTKLQTTFSGNFVALWKSNNNNNNSKNVNNNGDATTVTPLTPQRFTLRQALDYFLDFSIRYDSP